MNPAELAHFLCRWLDPYAVLETGRRWDVDRAGALAPGSIAMGSTVLETSGDAGLRGLVENFVSGFAIPAGILECLRVLFADAGISDEAWSWIAGLRFEGTVEEFSGEQSALPLRLLLLIRERDAVTNVLTQPLNVLGDVVGRLAPAWRVLLSCLS